MPNKPINDEFYLSLFETSKSVYAEAERRLHGFDLEQQAQELISVLNSRDPSKGLTNEQIGSLLFFIRNRSNAFAIDLIKKYSRALRFKLFNTDVATMVPIELTSFCSSNCIFCGWKSSNIMIPRSSITFDTLTLQLEKLAKLGFSHIEFSGGDDLEFWKNNLVNIVKFSKDYLAKNNYSIRLSLCATPLADSAYSLLKKNGLDTVLTWQETYDEKTYKHFIKGGPKAYGIDENFNLIRNGNGFLDRMRSHERAVKNNLQVGLGVMLGLNKNIEADILSAISHAQELIENYGDSIQPIIIGMPTWNTITMREFDRRSESDQTINIESVFELISAIYLLSLPDYKAWVFPNCRVSRKVQVDSILTAGFFTSTMVRLSPGAYLDEDELSKVDNLFLKSKNFLEKDTKRILLGEQFTHHYSEHSTYLYEFEVSQLKPVSEIKYINHPSESKV